MFDNAQRIDTTDLGFITTKVSERFRAVLVEHTAGWVNKNHLACGLYVEYLPGFDVRFRIEAYIKEMVSPPTKFRRIILTHAFWQDSGTNTFSVTFTPQDIDLRSDDVHFDDITAEVIDKISSYAIPNIVMQASLRGVI